MDPVSAVGLAGGCDGLLAKMLAGESELSLLHSKLKNAHVAISALLAQLSALETTNRELKHLLNEQVRALDRRDSFLVALDPSLAACDSVVACLLSHVAGARAAVEAGSGLSR